MLSYLSVTVLIIVLFSGTAMAETGNHYPEVDIKPIRLELAKQNQNDAAQPILDEKNAAQTKKLKKPPFVHYKLHTQPGVGDATHGQHNR